MARQRQDSCLLLIKLILIIQLCYSYHLYVAEATGSHFEKEFEQCQNGDESHCLKNRMSNAELKIEQQGEEIVNLKTTVDESKEVINQLSEHLENLGESTTVSSGKELLFRKKRPFRLIPVRKDSENIEEQTTFERFYGPPTSCNELRKLGYTLNGFYLVNGVNDRHQIEIIYCQFKSPHAGFNLDVKEERFGFVNLNSILLINKAPDTGKEKIQSHASTTVVQQMEMISSAMTSSKPPSKDGKESAPLMITTTLQPKISLQSQDTSGTNLKQRKKKKGNDLLRTSIEPTPTFFEITTETPTVTKKMKQECDPNYKIFLLKSEDHGVCLKFVNENSLSMSKCINSAAGQHWTQLRFLGKSSFAHGWMHICFAYGDKCLTAKKTDLFNQMQDDFSLNPLHHGKSEQKWVISDNGQLVNQFGGRLVAYLKNSLNSPSSNKWKFGVEKYVIEPAHKWSFLEVKDGKNNTLCAKKLTS